MRPKPSLIGRAPSHGECRRRNNRVKDSPALDKRGGPHLMMLPQLKPLTRLQHQQLVADHCATFQVDLRAAQQLFSPYRIRPLGAHIDHQLGRVASIATNQGITVTFSPSPNRRFRARSAGFGPIADVVIGASQTAQGDWADYLRGSAAVMDESGFSAGLDISVTGHLGEVGLSSSAAVTLAYLRALRVAAGAPHDPARLIQWSQRVENEFLGLQSGAGDQSAICYATPGCLVDFDCRSETVFRHPAGQAFHFLVVHSGHRLALASGGGFNQRVAECHAAAKAVQGLLGQPETAAASYLGDFDATEYEAVAGQLSKVSRRRAEHYFTEMARVDAGCKAWAGGDLAGFGKLMSASCESSIVNYETGTPALIGLVEALWPLQGVYGARFSGAGSRGCVVALVDAAAVPEILPALAQYFTGLKVAPPESPWAFVTEAEAGLRAV